MEAKKCESVSVLKCKHYTTESSNTILRNKCSQEPSKFLGKFEPTCVWTSSKEQQYWCVLDVLVSGLKQFLLFLHFGRGRRQFLERALLYNSRCMLRKVLLFIMHHEYIIQKKKILYWEERLQVFKILWKRESFLLINFNKAHSQRHMPALSLSGWKSGFSFLRLLIVLCLMIK